MYKDSGLKKALVLICISIAFLVFLPTLHSVQAQIRPIPTGTDLSGVRSRGTFGNRGNQNPNSNSNFPADTNALPSDTSATKGLIFHTEEPDSVLRQRVFLFHHRPTRVWVDEVWNPSLDPTGAQFSDPLDALNGNYYLGKGTLGHPHVSLYPTLADGLQLRLQPVIYAGYAYTMRNIDFYQTLTPFSLLGYGGSLNGDHSLRVSHTQNIMPGWNVAFNYRLFNPEGVYTSSGALNNYLSATTHYFTRDSRLQASAALIWQAFNIDENGGLRDDNIFINQLQSNRAGIPVLLNNAGSLQRDLAALGRITYSLERQSASCRHRDSLILVQINDSTTRLDTIDLVDTLPLGKSHVINPGVVGLEFNYDRQRRRFTDSTLWREQTATLFWTNDAYTRHRWRNPLKVTVGIQPRYIRAFIYGDTLRSYAWVNPFIRTEVALGQSTLQVEACQQENPWSSSLKDRRLAALLTVPFDSSGMSYASLEGVLQDKAPDLVYRQTSTAINNQRIQRVTLHLKHRELVDLTAGASHLSHHVWFDSTLTLHEGSRDLWLLQASLLMKLAVGPVHFDMQQLLQHSTDRSQLPVPLWATKNSLYADFHLFHRTLRMQAGVDVRYHTAYHAPLYDPATGLFLQQETLMVGNYLWGDVFVNMQVKRASIYLKAGHVNALWENPATYFLLPHYPGQKFGLQWGLTWCFFD